MDYIFIFGRNPDLSFSELLSFFSQESIPIKDSVREGHAAYISLQKKLSLNTLEKLGGTIAVAEVLTSGKNFSTISRSLDRASLYEEEKNNITYALWTFGDASEELEDYLKGRFKEERLRASRKPLITPLELQDGTTVNILGSEKKVDLQLVSFSSSFLAFGKVVWQCDYDSLEHRDMKKPVRREALAVSPRISKIMITLSEAPRKGTLLDAFCGIGSILQEGLLQGLRVYGYDRDKDAISGCLSNLHWGVFSKESYTVLCIDSRHATAPEVDVMVSEPDLGEILRKMPTVTQAKKTLRHFEELMIAVIRGAGAKVSGNIVFSAPYIKTIKGRKGAQFDVIAQAVGRKVREGFPLADYRKNQLVGREIVVLER